MPAPAGNQFWMQRSTHGRGLAYKSSDELWEAATQYFQWVEDNPLIEHRVAQFQGEQVDMHVRKMRAMTLTGLCRFIGMTRLNFDDYGKREDFMYIVTEIKAVIYDQKLVGAAADMLNANIIARELQLGDKSIVVRELPPTPEKRRARINDLLDKCSEKEPPINK